MGNAVRMISLGEGVSFPVALIEGAPDNFVNGTLVGLLSGLVHSPTDFDQALSQRSSAFGFSSVKLG